MRTLFLLALAVSASAPDSTSSLSLQQALELAQQRNPAVTAARHRVEAARGRLTGAKALPNPLVSKSVAGTFDEGPALLSQTFDVLGKLTARTRSAAAEARVAEAELQATTLAVSSSVESAYVELVAAFKARELTAEAVRLAQSLYEKTQAQLDAGDVPRAHVIRTRLELGRLQQTLVAAEGEIAVKAAALNNLVVRNPSTPLAVAEELKYEAVSFDDRTLLPFSRAHRPELVAARETTKSREAQVSLARAQRNPDFVLQARRAGTGLAGQNTFVGLGVSLPLFDWGSIRGAVREAKADAAVQVALTQQLENLIALEVETALRRVRVARAQAENYQKQIVPDADELIRMMLASYPQGATILDVIDAQRTAVAARTESFQAIANYRKAIAELRRAVGGELTPVARRDSR